MVRFDTLFWQALTMNNVLMPLYKVDVNASLRLDEASLDSRFPQ